MTDFIEDTEAFDEIAAATAHVLKDIKRKTGRRNTHRISIRSEDEPEDLMIIFDDEGSRGGDRDA